MQVVSECPLGWYYATYSSVYSLLAYRKKYIYQIKDKEFWIWTSKLQPNKWSLIREFIESHANCSGDGYANVGGVNTIAITIVIAIAELEYCASAASMLAEEIWQIAEGFMEVPVSLLA